MRNHLPLLINKLPVLASCAGLALLSACGSAQPPASSPAAGGAPAGSNEPVKPKVDRVVFALPPFSTEGNDVGRDFSAPLNVQLRPMYDKLVGIDPKDNKLVPELATEWKVEPDGKSYRFTLRKGVQFHDNAGEFTAKDVKMTYDDVTQTGTQASNGPIFKALIEDIQQVNDYEVVTKLKNSDAEFIINLSQEVGGFEIVSKADFDKRGFPTMSTRPLAGTGPYQFKERQQGAFIRFERVPFKHYRITPDFPEIELRMQAEASTRMAGLLTGEVHLAPLPEDLLQQAEKQQMKVVKGLVPGLRVFLSLRGMYLNDIKDATKGYKFPNTPFRDIKVRQALNKAVNRDELNKAFFGGQGQKMILNSYHPQRLGWNPDWEKQFPAMYDYDPEKAKSLLAEAGYTTGNPLKLDIILTKLTDVPTSEDIEESITQYWRKVGVDANLVRMDSSELNQRQRNLDFDHHVVIASTASHMLTGVRVYQTALHGIRGQAIELPEVNDLYAKVSTILDDKQAEPVWRELGNKAFANFQSVPLLWLDTKIATNPKFVADYQFPGSISGSWTHLETIKAAR